MFPKTSRSKTILLAIPAILVVWFIVWMSWDLFATAGELPSAQVPHPVNVAGKLILARRATPNGDLLLKILNEDTIFRYKINTKAVSSISREEWDAATGKVSICGGSYSGGAAPYNAYGAYGKYVLAVVGSPDDSKVAVVSAYGPKINTGGGFMFGGGETIYGSRYLEIKENADPFKTIGKPFRIHDFTYSGMCWPDDEKLVLIFDAFDLFDISVLNLDPSPANEPVEPPATSTASKPDLSAFTGSVRDSGIDEDGDGLIDKLAVEVETETSFPGMYMLRVSLKSEKGNHYTENTEVDLKEGLNKTTLLFDTKPMFEAGDGGTFEVSLIDLSLGPGLTLDQRTDIGKTAKYELLQLQHPNIVFTGKNTVTPIDKNKNGKFEGLEIRVGVDAMHPGNFEFQGDLYDEFSKETQSGLVEFGSGNARLNKGPGELVFFFSGENIIKHGVSGRFRLCSVTVSFPGPHSPLKDVLLTIAPFDIDQFEAIK